ncbi:MAG: outer membrane beta-barrel protein [Phycisphaerae bacterium]
MLLRKDAVSIAVLGLLATCGFAAAESTAVSAPALSLDPVVTAQDAGAPSTPLMMGLDKLGLAKPVQSAGLNIYGWVEAGYDVNLRNNESAHGSTHPGPFTREFGNHVIFNQLALRVEKLVDSKKWDVGGLVEVNFGTDDNFTTPASAKDGTFSSGWELTHIGDSFGESPELDIPQAYVDVNVPVGNGLKVRAGRFYTITGYESFDPRGNPFYTHSLIFSSEPAENTGVIAFYQLNDQWSVAGGISRGINQNTEDNNAWVDGLAQVIYTPNKQWTITLNAEVGPQNNADNSHWQTLINPIAAWQVTDKLKLGGEGIYVYDGGLNGSKPFGGPTHAYGDYYGTAGYVQYAINDYLTANARAEWFHSYFGSNENQYELTLGVIIKPMPKDPIGQNLMIRPEIRYDVAEDHLYPVGSGSSVFRDQWTAGADVIFTF